jgi:hypothetical protein
MMLSGLIVPFRAFLVAAVGAAIAWGWYDDREWLSVIAPLVVVGGAYAVSEYGVRRVQEDPVLAVRLMPWRILVPGVIAAVAAGVAIIVTVELTIPESPEGAPPTPTDYKEIVGALSTAITAFLSAAFIDWTGDGEDSRVADWIETTFHEKYKNVFQSGSRGELLVYSSYVIDGWAGPARRKRAKGIAEALQDKNQRRPST